MQKIVLQSLLTTLLSVIGSVLAVSIAGGLSFVLFAVPNQQTPPSVATKPAAIAESSMTGSYIGMFSRKLRSVS